MLEQVLEYLHRLAAQRQRSAGPVQLPEAEVELEVAEPKAV
jgi:hypothetical protein